MGKKYTTVIDSNNPHLGGNFYELNPSTFCSEVWRYIIDKYAIKSVLDVGAGRGHAAKFFSDLGLNTQAIDGLQQNVDTAVFPVIKIDLLETSFETSVDLVNCIEVVEHVEEKYLDNLLATICSGRWLLMTHGLPGQDGWHHVNNQLPQYWIDHLDRRGFDLLVHETEEIKKRCGKAHHVKDSGMLFQRR